MIGCRASARVILKYNNIGQTIARPPGSHRQNIMSRNMSWDVVDGCGDGAAVSLEKVLRFDFGSKL